MRGRRPASSGPSNTQKNTPEKRKEKDSEIHPETRFIIQFPETGDEKQSLTLDQIKNIYTGYAFFVRPVARADERAGPASIESARDWFWSAFRKNRTIYIEVIIAALMINLFGIASSLFVMNVYDRVVPNKAFETLWALAIGMIVVYVFDFMLKNLRAHSGPCRRRADVQISADLFEQSLA